MKPSASSSTRHTRRALFAGGGAALACAALFPGRSAHATMTLLNVSYDPTRELYSEINSLFQERWTSEHPQMPLSALTSNGGSGAQARAVLEGAPADVVSLGLSRDIDILADYGLLPHDWQKRLPYNSTPFSSRIIFLVRKGNPKNIKDWADLIRDDVKVITPNPKTSGGARWNYMAAWGWALQQPGGSDASAQAYMKKLFAHVPVLDAGARGATNSFVQRGLGDVLLAWENEALLAARDLGPDKFDIVTPSVTIIAEPPVALIDRNVKAHGTQESAQAYLDFLFTPQAQAVGAKHYFRPADPAVAAQFKETFAYVPTFDIASLGGWQAVHKKHFASGGLFDQIISQ
ncbi:MAG: sulfate ABC transporter substrate-binding protein [Acetobacter sp.]|nr:sulfate ABC transporter substrate-binding protein [Acetobacter sp.]MCH4061083.1 sulfate ABC transporter substrate-binding protein [Acetobacter sp.]MCH4088022.1 sulfate ABC transporter substrate-binding protein [Acetobacter sp.]MCI1293364.1 sulfate ABC transporter substrate-binding protein [Acetobacter sp.]MCI1320011.1 sulfate ABC transporter substrate-binding protein [Acetobacter sp.]